MKRALILYNDRAGHGRIARKIDAIAQIFVEGGYDVEVASIEFGCNPFDEPQHCAVDLVVVCGGDGTVNYILNAMKAHALDLTLGIIPAGTANDFAGAIGMRKGLLKAARQIVAGRAERLDCARVNDLYFINIFSFGLFTTTSQHTPDALKHTLGKAAYIIEGSKELHHSEYIPLHITHDGGEEQTEALIVLVFNGETAGQFRLAREASVRDGVLDVLIMSRCNILDSARAMLMFLLNGKPNAAIKHIRTSHIEMRSPLNPPTDMDGQKSAEFPLSIECIAGGVSVVCPCDNSADNDEE